jgi:hypothetical protein
MGRGTGDRARFLAPIAWREWKERGRSFLRRRVLAPMLSSAWISLRIRVTLSELFTSLGAPLANQRWSWGAVRKSDGAVFLRVWQHEGRTVDGLRVTQVSFGEFFKRDPANLGCAERLGHLELVRNGSPSYMIMCLARDPTATRRVIKSFDRDSVFLGGRLVDIDGDLWLERADRLPITKARIAS